MAHGPSEHTSIIYCTAVQPAGLFMFHVCILHFSCEKICLALESFVLCTQQFKDAFVIREDKSQLLIVNQPVCCYKM